MGSTPRLYINPMGCIYFTESLPKAISIRKVEKSLLAVKFLIMASNLY